MRVEVLHTAECPHAIDLIEYLDARADIETTITLVTADEAVPHGFAGSPTILVEGSNPFGSATVTAPACALRPPTVHELDAFLSTETDEAPLSRDRRRRAGGTLPGGASPSA